MNHDLDQLKKMATVYYVKVKPGPFHTERCIAVAANKEQATKQIESAGYEVISVRKAPEKHNAEAD